MKVRAADIFAALLITHVFVPLSPLSLSRLSRLQPPPSIAEVPAPVPALASDLEARVRPHELCARTYIHSLELAVLHYVQVSPQQSSLRVSSAANKRSIPTAPLGMSSSATTATGHTCDYGVRNSCVKCGELSC